jgi:DNA repair exonuclease SbcCD ATPase subunit
MKSFVYIIRTILLTTVLFSLFPGCAWNDKTEKEDHILAQNEALHKKNTELQKEIDAKKELNANLKIRLLEKNAEINKLKVIQQDLGKEVVHSKTKMISPESKAEAAAVLAETETEINTVKEQALAGNRRLPFASADQLMEKSRTEFALGHYGKACTFAAQALAQVQTMQLKAETMAKPVKGQVNHFVFPLVMQLVQTSNIRERPSMKGRILFILERGTQVTATGYRGHWIRIIVKDQPFGWIYYTLLALPES